MALVRNVRRGEQRDDLAMMDFQGLADGVISDDSDTLMYGAEVVLRRLYFDAMYVEMYSSSRMPDRLRDHDAMVGHIASGISNGA